MIFGDEPRFQKSAVAHPLDRQIHGFAKLETDAHVGPGVYFSNGEEEKRNGWKSRSFSKREPMTPSKSPSSRNDHYTAGVVTSYGALASPLSPRERSYPGPGHYDGDLMTSFSSKSGSPTVRAAVCLQQQLIFQQLTNSIVSDRSDPLPRRRCRACLALGLRWTWRRASRWRPRPS